MSREKEGCSVFRIIIPGKFGCYRLMAGLPLSDLEEQLGAGKRVFNGYTSDPLTGVQVLREDSHSAGLPCGRKNEGIPKTNPNGSSPGSAGEAVEL